MHVERQRVLLSGTARNESTIVTLLRSLTGGWRVVITIPSNYRRGRFCRKVSLVCHDILVVFNLQTHILVHLRVNWTVFVTEYCVRFNVLSYGVHPFLSPLFRRLPFRCGDTSSPAISSRGNFVAWHFVAGTLRKRSTKMKNEDVHM